MINNDYQSGVLRGCNYFQFASQLWNKCSKSDQWYKIMFQATKYGHTVPVSGCSSRAFTQSLGLIIPHGQCVSGHVVQASFSPAVRLRYVTEMH